MPFLQRKWTLPEKKTNSQDSSETKQVSWKLHNKLQSVWSIPEADKDI